MSEDQTSEAPSGSIQSNIPAENLVTEKCFVMYLSQHANDSCVPPRLRTRERECKLVRVSARISARA